MLVSERVLKDWFHDSNHGSSRPSDLFQDSTAQCPMSLKFGAKSGTWKELLRMIQEGRWEERDLVFAGKWVETHNSCCWWRWEKLCDFSQLYTCHAFFFDFVFCSQQTFGRPEKRCGWFHGEKRVNFWEWNPPNKNLFRSCLSRLDRWWLKILHLAVSSKWSSFVKVVSRFAISNVTGGCRISAQWW